MKDNPSNSISLWGLGLFAVLIIVAGSLYPGGSERHPDKPGFDLVYNFWCDLFMAEGINGATNPGRGLAIAATVLLFLSLIPLIATALRRYPIHRVLIRPLQILAAVALCGTTLIPSPWHDFALTWFIPLLAAVYFALLVGLFRAKEWVCFAMGILPLVLGLLSHISWSKIGIQFELLPLLPKIAMLGFFSWIYALQKTKSSRTNSSRGP